jgi:hypothetical protein
MNWPASWLTTRKSAGSTSKSVLPKPAPRPRRRTAHEDPVHEAVAEHLRLTLRPGWVWWSTPSQGQRSYRQQRRLKSQGMVAGISDIVLVSPEGILHALELKRERAASGRALGRLSPAQIGWLASLPPACPRACAHGVDEALTVLRSWQAIS